MLVSWWHNGLSNRARVWLILGFFSLCVHGILMMVLCMYRGAPITCIDVNLLASRRNVPIKLLPLCKRVDGALQQIDAVQQKQEPIVQQRPTELPKKQEAPKPLPKAVLASPKAKVQTKPQQKMHTHVEPHVKPQVKPLVKSEVKPSVLPQEQHKEKPVQQEPILVGTHDMAVVRLHEAVYTSITAHWRPLVGVKRGISCTMQLRIGWDGVVQEALVTQRSGVPAFDMSVRVAVKRAVLPQQAWGKDIVLTFNA